MKDDQVGFNEKKLYCHHRFEEDILLGRKKQPNNVIWSLPPSTPPGMHTILSQVLTPQTANTSNWSSDPHIDMIVEANNESWTPTREENLLINLETNFVNKTSKSSPCQMQFDQDASHTTGMSQPAISQMMAEAGVPMYFIPQENGLYFRPDCTSECMTGWHTFPPCKDGHECTIHVPLNNIGDYVMFPSATFHWGYYNEDCWKVFITA